MASNASIHGGNELEMEELLENNQDQVPSSSPQIMETVTFSTYEEVTLTMPRSDTYKPTIYHTHIDIQPTSKSQQQQQVGRQKKSCCLPITWLGRLVKFLIAAAVIGNLIIFVVWSTKDMVSTYIISHFKP